MNSLSLLVATSAMLAASLPAAGQALADPMRPPSQVGSEPTPGEASGAALQLQSTLTSSGRRIAVIGGRPVRVGDKLGAATIVAIEAGSVTLEEAGARRVIGLVDRTGKNQPRGAAEPVAPLPETASPAGKDTR